MPWDQLLPYFAKYGPVGILVFVLVAGLYYKLIRSNGENVVKTFVTNRKIKKQKQCNVLTKLDEINEKIGVLNQIFTRTNENLNKAIRDIKTGINELAILIHSIEISAEDKEKLMNALKRIEDKIQEK
jgi:enoyl-[acyl-carrier-protein] reductase (NADH)